MTPLEIAGRLPDPEPLRERCRNLATLEAILCPQWEWRYYSFDPQWSTREMMASMRNGSGDTFFVVFSEQGAVLRAFDHESELSPWGRDDGRVVPGLLDGIPDELRHVIDEPAFRTEGGPETDLTFCAWHSNSDDQWRVGTVTDDGGATYLLKELLDPTPASCLAFVREYHEVEPDTDAVSAVWNGAPLDEQLVARINPDAEARYAIQEAKKIGYPVMAT